MDSALGPLVTNTRAGVTAGSLGSFFVEGAKGSFPGVSLANNAQLKQLLKNLQE